MREAEALARKAANPEGPVGGRAARPAIGGARGKDADTRALEEDLADVLGLEVAIDDRGGVGELRIRFATLEQLDELCRRLTRSAG